jgi:hypothetical protein
MRARLLALFADLWAWPITAAGRLAARWGGAAWLRDTGGARWYVASERGLCGRFFAHFGFAAFAWGATVIVADASFLDSRPLVRHELEHVAQARRWGVLLPLAYVLAGCWAVLRGGQWYWDNYFERQARAAE